MTLVWLHFPGSTSVSPCLLLGARKVALARGYAARVVMSAWANGCVSMVGSTGAALKMTQRPQIGAQWMSQLPPGRVFPPMVPSGCFGPQTHGPLGGRATMALPYARHCHRVTTCHAGRPSIHQAIRWVIFDMINWRQKPTQITHGCTCCSRISLLSNAARKPPWVWW